MHLMLDAYLLVLRKLLPPEALLEVGHRHLVATCAICRDELQVDLEEAEPWSLPLPVLTSPLPFPKPLPTSDRHLGEEDLDLRLPEWEAVRELRILARRHLRILLEEPADRWVECVEQSRSRYRSRAFAELLIEESRERVRREPEVARDLAALVPVVVRWIPGAEAADWVPELLVRSMGWKANALRVAGDLVAADRQFSELHSFTAAATILDPWTRGELCSLEASLRIDQRRHGAAEELLREAQALFRQTGDEEGLGRVLTKHGNLLYTRNLPEEALAAFQHAAEHLERVEGTPFLHYSALNGRIAALCDLDRLEEARDLLEREAPAFVERGDRHVEGLVHHLRGRVALGLGDTSGAEESLLLARQAYLETDRTYDAVLASLDLAQTYLEAGRLGDLEVLAGQLVPQFEARGVTRETLAALRLLARAAAGQQATQDLLNRLRDRVKAAPGVD